MSDLYTISEQVEVKAGLEPERKNKKKSKSYLLYSTGNSAQYSVIT